MRPYVPHGTKRIVEVSYLSIKLPPEKFYPFWPGSRSCNTKLILICFKAVWEGKWYNSVMEQRNNYSRINSAVSNWQFGIILGWIEWLLTKTYNIYCLRYHAWTYCKLYFHCLTGIRGREIESLGCLDITLFAICYTGNCRKKNPLWFSPMGL